MPAVEALESTATRLFVVVPLPSCPKSLPPQHMARPPPVTAQVWESPAAIATIAELLAELLATAA